MLSLFMIYLIGVAIPRSAALPAAAPDDLIDFGKLDITSTPETCKDTCAAFTKQWTAGCASDLKCMCSDDIGSASGPCFSCLAGVANTTQAATTAQLVLSQWANICHAGGFTVATPSFSAQAVVESSASSAAVSSSVTGSASVSGGNLSASSTSASATTASSASTSSSASASKKPNQADVLQVHSGSAAIVGALWAFLFI
ncbi:hypothetical protein B0H10DRAFT_7967 [Mycena sp. CBHHK59/15]|nr:hypothetical protein B0H10DRAFT_7967 [Mycena sp. CBHHK59/15]